MLAPWQRTTLFILFCLVAVACVVVEIWIALTLVGRGTTELGTVAAVLSGTVLLGVGALFVRLVQRTFLDSAVVSPSGLAAFDADRNRIVDNHAGLGLHGYAARRELVTNTLKFAESRLRGWIPGTHFELSVFLDQAEPILFSYFDSAGNEQARSMSGRTSNPKLYVEQGYEIVRVLSTPSSYPVILGDTQAAGTRYAFASPAQKKQVRSTILLCLDVGRPCGLVVTSDHKNAFVEKDVELLAFVRLVGNLVRYDLFEGGFVDALRVDHPGLFSPA